MHSPFVGMVRTNKPGDKPRNRPTRTHTKEYGYYIREKWSKGKKRKQKTTKVKKNSEKVLLCRIGDVELYVYPKDYPDKIFMGIFPMSTTLEAFQVKDLLRAYNRAKWFINGDWQKTPRSAIGAKSLRQRILKSIDLGVKRMKEAQKTVI